MRDQGVCATAPGTVGGPTGRRVKRRSERYTFQEEVAAIATQIGEIRVTDFRGTDREKREIRRLWKVVNKRLRPLI